MLGATTTDTTTTTSMTSLSTLPTNIEDTNPLTPNTMESSKSLDQIVQSFTPGQCLFCPITSSTLEDGMVHMQKSHGLFIPQQQHLAVDLETFFRYLHLVIFEYRECLYCETTRSTVQAVQQHMMGKGHCKFDLSEESEFADFYDFYQSQDDVAEDSASDSGNDKDNRRPLKVDQDSMRLPSGRLISKKTSAQAEPSLSQIRRRPRTTTPQIEYVNEPDIEPNTTDGISIPDTQTLTRRERRQKATAAHQLANMSVGDRTALMHLSSAEQRSLIATNQRFKEKTQKEEAKSQRRIDRKGNKNLYAYWHTETPVYQCG
ncbi:unnamed protein product [Fusarium equiseti]|uniref:ZN622/Rei1/Reh1 zinc finger C2H2-type domain-containing protein n=1 Tax=Fusarium equiseti TaxID=61235 RepID=A0A8J2IEP0_FUSEQ|nr:unnamed protein product [Fusarium equiseti]